MANLMDLMTKNEAGEIKPRIDKGLVALFLGKSGSGKDCAQASFPGKSYVFDVDNRIRGMRNAAMWLGEEKLRDIDFDFYNPDDGFKGLDAKLTEFADKAKRRDLKYQNIFINSVSSMTHMLTIESRTVRGVNKGRTVAGVQMTDPSDYNFLSQAMRNIQFRFIMPLAEMGINIIFSGHMRPRFVKAESDNAGGIDYQGATIESGQELLCAPSLARELPGYFDEVYEFNKISLGALVKYNCKFLGDLAKTSLPIAGKELDLTNKPFYDQWKALVESSSYQQLKKG